MTQAERDQIINAAANSVKTALDAALPSPTELPKEPLKLSSKRLQAAWECVSVLESGARKLVSLKTNGRLQTPSGIVSDSVVNLGRNMIRGIETIKSSLTQENLENAITASHLVKDSVVTFVKHADANEVLTPDMPDFLPEFCTLMGSNVDALVGNLEYMRG